MRVFKGILSFLYLATTVFELSHTVSKITKRNISFEKIRTKHWYFKDFYVINNRLVYHDVHNISLSIGNT